MSTHKEHTISRTYIVIAISCLAVACTQAGIVMYTPSIPFLLKIFNTGYAEIAYTLTGYLLGYALSVLFFGGISDQLGIKKSYMVTTAIFSLGSIFLAIAHSIYFFILFRFLQGIGGGGCAVIARTSARDRLDGKKLVNAMSYISISFITSLGIFQYLGGIIQTYGNYKYDFIVMSCFGFVVLMLITFFFNDNSTKSKTIFKTTHLIKNYSEIVKKNYLFPIALGSGIGYSILLTFNVLGIYYLQIYLKISPHQTGLIGIYFSISYLIGSVLANILIKISDLTSVIKTGRLIILLAGFLSIICITINKNSAFLIVFPLLIGLVGQALLYPCAMVKALEPYKSTPGAASSLFGFTQQFTGLIISMIVGWLPNYSIFSLGIIVIVIASISFLLLSDHFLHQKI